MKSFPIFFCVAFVTCLVEAIDFEDIYMFLPALKDYQPPPACPANEMYKTCTGKCSDCQQRGMCVITSCMQGCDCVPRFFRVTPDGPCEPVAKCPRPECGENEVFRECGPICERCTTIKCRVINCDHKCYCKEGYLRNVEDVCIPAEECPNIQRCGNTEELADSGPVDEYCLHRENATISDETRNASMCYCQAGFKRNTLGHCINETLCPYITCLGVEVYYDCIPQCNTTCRNYGDQNCIEDGNCYPGCFCPSGFVMNDLRNCVPVEECTLYDFERMKMLEESETEDEEESSDVQKANTENDSQNANAENDSEKASIENDSEKASIENDSEKASIENDSQKANTESDSEEANTESDSEKANTENDSEKVNTENVSEKANTESYSEKANTENDSEATAVYVLDEIANVTETTEYTSGNVTLVDDLNVSEQIPNVTRATTEPITTETTESPVLPSPSTLKDTKEKSNAKTKSSKQESPKHANAAASSETSKEGTAKDFDSGEF